MSSALSVASLRTRARSPPSCNRSTVTPCLSAQATYTSPTGFSFVPPPGPAMPVVATAISAPLYIRGPLATSKAVCSLTAPNTASVSGFTPQYFTFASLA